MEEMMHFVNFRLQYWRPWPRKINRLVTRCLNRLFRFHRFLFDETRRRKTTFAVLILVLMFNLVSPRYPPIKCQKNVTDDSTISRRFRGEVISTSMVLGVSLLITLLQFCITEWFINKQPSNPYGFNPIETSRWKVTLFFVGRWYRDYFCGFAFMILIVEVAKTTMAAPRPHWIDSCTPVFPSENCIMGWVESYNCTNPYRISNYKLSDARKSFPSGHAALGFYSGIFMIIYQHYRVSVKKLGVVVSCWIYIIWGTWAVYCGLSRVSDFRHHPIDVMFGGILGVATAFFTALVLCRKFRKEFTLESFQNKMSGLNGNATIMEGYSSSPSPPHLNSTTITNANESTITNVNVNGRIPSRTNGNENRKPSLRRLLSTQSAVTTMSDIPENMDDL